MTTLIKALEAEIGLKQVKTNEPMSHHTSLRIGGPSELFLEIDQIEELIKVVRFLQKRSQPFIILGASTRTLFPTEVTPGVVIKNNCRTFEMMSMKGQIKNGRIAFDDALLYADSGTMMNQIVRYTLDQSFGGLEYALGLPGTVGGAIATDAYYPKTGKHVLDSVKTITILDDDGEIREVDSVTFKEQKKKCSILQVVFKIHTGDKKTLWEQADGAVAFRAEHFPRETVIGPMFTDISIADAMTIPTPNYNTSPSYLIKKVGLHASKAGIVRLSETDANYLSIEGETTADQLVSYIKKIQRDVYTTFKIQLELGMTIVN